jgi:glycosyltransferase involved in cell wall biosynthesis
MKEPIVTLIVPYYRNVHTIDRTLLSIERSLEKVRLGEVEILFIDNNSIDGTSAKVIGFTARNALSSVVKEEMQGVSHARNGGLTRANGNYVAFMDADDEILPNYFDELLEAISGSPDVIVINLFGEGRTGVTKCGVDVLVSKKLRGWWPFQFVFKRELAQGLRFIGKCYEDFGFFPFLASRATGFAIINRPLYKYHYGTNSISNPLSQTADKIDELKEQFDNMIKHNEHLSMCVLNRVKLDYYNQLSLLRCIMGVFPLLSLQETLLFLSILKSDVRRLEYTVSFARRNFSVLYRIAKLYRYRIEV